MTPTTPAGRQLESPSLPPVPPSFCRWHRFTSPEQSGQSDPSGERLSLPNIPSAPWVTQQLWARRRGAKGPGSSSATTTTNSPLLHAAQAARPDPLPAAPRPDRVPLHGPRHRGGRERARGSPRGPAGRVSGRPRGASGRRGSWRAAPPPGPRPGRRPLAPPPSAPRHRPSAARVRTSVRARSASTFESISIDLAHAVVAGRRVVDAHDGAVPSDAQHGRRLREALTRRRRVAHAIARLEHHAAFRRRPLPLPPGNDASERRQLLTRWQLAQTISHFIGSRCNRPHE